MAWLASCAALLASCTTGSVERPEKEGPGDPETLEEVTFDFDEEQGPSETHRAALENQPTEDPVSDVPASLECEGDPGTKRIHRLNALEYRNTVRDLLRLETVPDFEFPKDDFADSFDNIATALTVSPLLTEAYQAAAEQLAALFITRELEGDEAPPGIAQAGAMRGTEFFTCTSRSIGAEACARQILTPFLSRAFRRPLFDDEVDPYVDLVLRARDDAGASFEEGIQAAVEAALLSVHFLFRVELDPESTQHHAVTDFELASRLSYFLWSSMPDEELFDAARQGTLNTEQAITAQVARMLEDPKAEVLLDAFIGRWFEVDDISRSNQPSEELFPEYTSEIKQAMETETRLFFRDLLRGELTYDQLLTADATYLNAELADYYDLDVDVGDEFEKVSLEGTERTGLLTQGSVLTLTAVATRTAPVRRGIFVLSNLLCTAPPPPPPEGVPDLDEPEESTASDAGVPRTLVDIAREHSANPECRGCHSLMDPIGFGLENFDAVGRYREEERGQPILTAGELALGGEPQSFSGARELSEILSEDSRLSSCAARKLFTFALGRLPGEAGAADSCRLQRLTEVFEDKEYDFRELMTMVTLTDSFRGRYGEDGRTVEIRSLNLGADAGTEN